MNDETILALGGFSKDLLSDENFKAMLQLFSQQIAAEIIGTKPHAVKEREQLYASHLGFEKFVALIGDFAKAFDKINHEHIDHPDEFDSEDVINMNETD